MVSIRAVIRLDWVQVRSHVEVQIGMIAKGQADKDAVVAHALHQFRQKFLFFVAKVARMDALFEASFSPLASSGDSHSHSYSHSNSHSRSHSCTCSRSHSHAKEASITL